MRIIALLMAVFTCVTVLASCTEQKKEREKQLFNYYYEFLNADELIESVCEDDFGAYTKSFLNIGSFTENGIWSRTAKVKEKSESGEENSNLTTLYTFDSSEKQFIKKKFYVVNQKYGYVFRSESTATYLLGILDDGTYVCAEFLLFRNADSSVNLNGTRVGRDDNGWYLTCYDSDGYMISSNLLFDIDARVADNNSILSESDIQLLSDGLIYVNNAYSANDRREARVTVMTPTGEFVSSVLLDDVCPDYASGKLDFYTVKEGMNGIVYLVFYSNDDYDLHFEAYRYYDLLDGKKTEPIRICQKSGARELLAFSDTEAYYRTYYGIYHEVFGNEEDEQILSWVDIDASGYGKYNIYFESAEKFLIAYVDNYTSDSYFIFVSRAENPYESQRQVITIAYDESKQFSTRAKATRNLLNIVSRFNRTSDGYRIKLIPYSSDDVSTANDKLYRDIISGEMPDMVLFGGSITADPFLKTGAFMDLYKFMDKDETYTRDAFLPCVLKPFEVKGKLPYIVTNFSFETLAGLTDVIGDKTSWTVDEFAELVDSLESGQYLMKVDSASDPQYELFRTILPYIVSDYVDYNKEKCDFGKEFKKLLETCKRAPVKAVDGYLATENYLDGDVVLGKISLGETSGYMDDRFAMFGDKDITLIGAPTKKGSGTALMYDLAFSITKDCAFPEGAWEFIKYYISAGPGQWENFIEMPQTVYFADGFIPTKETEEEMFTVLDTMVFYFNTTPTRLDNGEEGISLSRWVGTKISTNELTRHIQDRANGMNNYYHKQLGYVPVYFSENDAEQLRAMFDDCRKVASKDDAVLSIILEEASAYFSGVRNIDDTVKFITDRVNTRIHE